MKLTPGVWRGQVQSDGLLLGVDGAVIGVVPGPDVLRTVMKVTPSDLRAVFKRPLENDAVPQWVPTSVRLLSVLLGSLAHHPCTLASGDDRFFCDS